MSVNLNEREPTEHVTSVHEDRLGQLLLDSLPVGLVFIDADLNILRRNRRSFELLAEGTRGDEVLADATRDKAYRNWNDELREVLETGLPKGFEGVPCQFRQARSRFYHIVINPLSADEAPDAIGGVIIVEDVTARLTLEERLAVSERMAALGKLASKVAHELNNPLDGILRYINLALRVLSSSDTERAEQYLTECRQGLLRMVGVVGDLLEFSRNARAGFGAGSVNELIEEALRNYEERINEQRVTVVCSFHDKAPTVRGSNLFQVFGNLIKNALDAMPEGGRLTVCTEVCDPLLVISFEDSGVGLPKEHERIFEPFFTTKPSGQGTGLGLALCREIVEKYAGQITALPGRTGGAVFRVEIPLGSCVAITNPCAFQKAGRSS